jgi:uncharacterized protein (UPF0264 family)
VGLVVTKHAVAQHASSNPLGSALPGAIGHDHLRVVAANRLSAGERTSAFSGAHHHGMRCANVGSCNRRNAAILSEAGDTIGMDDR